MLSSLDEIEPAEGSDSKAKASEVSFGLDVEDKKDSTLNNSTVDLKPSEVTISSALEGTERNTNAEAPIRQASRIEVDGVAIKLEEEPPVVVSEAIAIQRAQSRLSRFGADGEGNELFRNTSVEELQCIAEQSTGCTGWFLTNLLDHAWVWWWSFVIVNVLWLGLMLYLTFQGETRDDQEWFWVGFAIKMSVISIIQLVAGWGAQNRGWKVGYTRKCVHVGFFLLPQLLDTVLPMPKDDAWLWGLWNVHLVSLMLLMITRPIRTKSTLITMMYAAVDRKEDHGLTMLYTFLQVPLTIIVIGGFSLFFKYWIDRQAWTLAPIIAVTFGDGLAEPLAVYWSSNKVCGGTHTYKTSALCAGDKKFTRSFEGSACVFLWTAAGVLLVLDELTDIELAINLIVMPVTMALLEAVAPHSMDNPFLLTWGCLVMIGAHGIDQWSESW